MELVSVYMLIVSLAFAILALILFGFGVIAQQGNMIQRELWRLKQDMWEAQPPPRGARDGRRKD